MIAFADDSWRHNDEEGLIGTAEIICAFNLFRRGKSGMAFEFVCKSSKLRLCLYGGNQTEQRENCN